MEAEEFSVQIDIEFINDFFKIAGKKTPPKEELSLEMLKKTLSEIETFVNRTKTSSRDMSSFSKIENTEKNTGDKILIIDDLGVITYQLEVLYKKSGFNPVISKEIYDAISKFKKDNYSFVIMDLFIPTEREGFILLDELLKIIKIKSLNTKIGIITASSKKEYKQICLSRGADFFVEKTDMWQKSLLEICKQCNEKKLLD